jgi:hypothetical protein
VPGVQNLYWEKEPHCTACGHKFDAKPSVALSAHFKWYVWAIAGALLAAGLGLFLRQAH